MAAEPKEPDVTMTVEVPVVLEIELDRTIVPNEHEPVMGRFQEVKSWVETAEPTPELQRVVKNALESDTVHVKEVFGASSYTADLGPGSA